MTPFEYPQASAFPDDAERAIIDRFHPLATLIPMRSALEIRSYADELMRGEFQPTVTLFENKILDGRATALACHRAGMEPTYVHYHGTDPVRYLLAKTGCHRHLTERQKVMIAARAATARVGDNQYSEGLPAGVASKLLGVSERTVQRAKAVIANGIPALISMVEEGKVSLRRAEEISELDETGQLDELTRPALRQPRSQRKSSHHEAQEADGQDHEPGAPLVPADADGHGDEKTQLKIEIAPTSVPSLSGVERECLIQLEALWAECSPNVRRTFLEHRYVGVHQPAADGTDTAERETAERRRNGT